jgi:hypothetical protein
MAKMVKNASEPPILWSIPFTLFVITLILAAVDTLIPFVPITISPQTWMWAISTLITSITATLVAEIISLDNRRSIFAMALSAVIFTLIYEDLYSVVRGSIVEAVQGAIPNPILGAAVYTLTLAIVPSALTGVILGGIFGSLPNVPPWKPESQIPIAPTVVEEHMLTGFEKFCGRCGHHAPFESRFCPYCGTELTKRRAPAIQYCRFCGARFNYLGQFCPDCGREIDIVSKPQIYISP